MRSSGFWMGPRLCILRRGRVVRLMRLSRAVLLVLRLNPISRLGNFRNLLQRLFQLPLHLVHLSLMLNPFTIPFALGLQDLFLALDPLVVCLLTRTFSFITLLLRVSRTPLQLISIALELVRGLLELLLLRLVLLLGLTNSGLLI